MQEPQEAADLEPIAMPVPSKDWHKPVATFVPIDSTANSPGSWPDAGINYS